MDRARSTSEPGSFRDRTSQVVYRDGAVYRLLTREALIEWEALSSTPFFRRFSESGSLVATTRLDETQRAPLVRDLEPPLADGCEAVLQHERMPFISYPFEWSHGMLADAALLHLDLMLAALDQGMILKDATPYNLQWRGSQPVFIDIPSFVRLSRGEPWIGYRQFCKLFLYPLMLRAYRNVPFQPWLRGNLSGIEPQHLWHLLSALDVLRPGVVGHVWLPSLLEHRLGESKRGVREAFKNAGFHHDMIKRNVRGLRRLIERLGQPASRSHWSSYGERSGYSPQDQESKQSFVRSVVSERRWKRVFDLGANTGVYSHLVAEHADYVVAMDADYASQEVLYRSLKASANRRILPLAVNAVDPSPGMGWQLSELKPVAGRGRPDLILCLALVHHLVLGENVPMPQLLAHLAEPRCSLIIEFPTLEDPRVQQYVRERPGQHHDYDRETFERCLRQTHDVVRSEILPGQTRVLYHARPLSGTVQPA